MVCLPVPLWIHIELQIQVVLAEVEHPENNVDIWCCLAWREGATLHLSLLAYIKLTLQFISYPGILACT